MPGSLSAGNPGLKPTNGTQQEYGVKTSFLKDKLTLSFAHFKISQSNYAVPNSEYYVLVAQGNQAARTRCRAARFSMSCPRLGGGGKLRAEPEHHAHRQYFELQIPPTHRPSGFGPCPIVWRPFTWTIASRRPAH